MTRVVVIFQIIRSDAWCDLTSLLPLFLYVHTLKLSDDINLLQQQTLTNTLLPFLFCCFSFPARGSSRNKNPQKQKLKGFNFFILSEMNFTRVKQKKEIFAWTSWVHDFFLSSVIEWKVNNPPFILRFSCELENVLYQHSMLASASRRNTEKKSMPFKRRI